ncbi:LysM peptidoglycan-binding domain-containing protein [Nocardioides sp. zg-579]|uniref:LysM peptidoglycan-binding domain-containing protein n=1 Tax=Nocardioides marmotae TaxID=2663857 RepID=A0A6I3IXJ1_9ACTN|nr:LysM peptidoglycan-binding domain-containing protein [Nocardioides marmotae]MCR6031454.1 LysM peptidoglycan-binding domain-containing protein [Gordonia jinghuaiqii]MTB95093.1 LysM peptidoglycan-binding domain-containing protein [Nocardioides marmotae]QKE02415.1 LysM peptidoglycan-binding domain-containing protein [Nocardioides marmotae]
MDEPRRIRPARCLLVELAATMTVAGLGAVALPSVPGAAPGPGTTFEDLLVGGCAVAVLVTSAWLWLLTTVVVVEALRGRTDRRAGVPRFVRTAVLAACGVALVVPAPALAAERPHPLDGLPMPDRATSTAAWVAAAVDGATRPPAREPDAPRTHVVRTGDTLWAIAAAGLSPTADPDDVVRRSHRLHQLNRAVIGDDPDLIHPGQRLRLPPAAHRGDQS